MPRAKTDTPTTPATPASPASTASPATHATPTITATPAWPRLMRWLSWINLAYLPVLILFLLMSVAIDSDFFKRPHSPLTIIGQALGLGWLLLIPASTTVGLVLNRKTRWRPGWWINGVVLGVWALLAGLQVYLALSSAFPSIVR
jgi:hypothetical protein